MTDFVEMRCPTGLDRACLWNQRVTKHENGFYLTQELDPELVCFIPHAAMTKNVGAMPAARACKVAHVLNQAPDGHVHLQQTTPKCFRRR